MYFVNGQFRIAGQSSRIADLFAGRLLTPDKWGGLNRNLRGSLKGSGLLKALMEDRKREREME
jgi:hypothetical protein